MTWNNNTGDAAATLLGALAPKPLEAAPAAAAGDEGFVAAVENAGNSGVPSAGLPAWLAELNDAEQLVLRDELYQVARELKAAAALRRMVQDQFGVALQELATAL